MSRRILTMIVTCTDRKSAIPPPGLMVRNLSPGNVSDRARAWTNAITSSPARHPILELYSGEAWSQVKRLAIAARSSGFEPNVLVASAGLGLHPVTDEAPAYAATFSAGHADTVALTRDDAREWWRALPHADANRGGRAIWVVSEAYARVISEDLMQRTAPDELLVFGGSRETPDNSRVPADRTLRRALGGTATSLNLRAAAQWLALSVDMDPFGSAAKDRWRAWSDGVRNVELYDRQPISDAEVLRFVTDLLRRQPSVSKTRALRVLRDSGLACEQSRFSALFGQVAAT